MAIKSNKNNFMNISSNVIKGIELVATQYINYDVLGLHDELMKDEEFMNDISIISCECDISKYFNTKSLCFMKVVKTMIFLNKENEIKKTINNIVDKNILDKIINLDKK
jgi:hypothetical protein